jgi:hypothetical protein
MPDDHEYTLEEIKTILTNLLNALTDAGDLSNIPWDTVQQIFEHWEELMELLSHLQDFPWDCIGHLPAHPPAVNQYTQIKLTRCRRESLNSGGRWEASHNLKGLVVLAADDTPPSLWYCTGEEWRRVNSMVTRELATYGYIIDSTPLAYNRGGIIQIPLSKLANVEGAVNGITIGMHIVDNFHAVGIITDVLTTEYNPDLAEDMAVIVTWIGEADGTNVFTNADIDTGLGSSGGLSGGNDTVARALAGIAQQDIDDHRNNLNNPHQTTAAQAGLDRVDNTRDVEKPLSALQAQAVQTYGSTLLQQAQAYTQQAIGNISFPTSYMGTLALESALPADTSALSEGQYYEIDDMDVTSPGFPGRVIWNGTAWDTRINVQRDADGVTIGYRSSDGAFEIRNGGVTLDKMADVDLIAAPDSADFPDRIIGAFGNVFLDVMRKMRGLFEFMHRAAGFATAAQGTAADNAVYTTGNQTVQGVKTFESIIEIPNETVFPAIPSPTQPPTQAQVKHLTDNLGVPFYRVTENADNIDIYLHLATITIPARINNVTWYTDCFYADMVYRHYGIGESGQTEDQVFMGRINVICRDDGFSMATSTGTQNGVDAGQHLNLYVTQEKDIDPNNGDFEVVYKIWFHRKALSGQNTGVCEISNIRAMSDWIIDTLSRPVIVFGGAAGIGGVLTLPGLYQQAVSKP